MSTINWDAIHGRVEVTTEKNRNLSSSVEWLVGDQRATEDETPDLGEFSQDDIDAALAKVAALPATDPTDDDVVATFWPIEDKFRLSDLDFRRVTVTDVTLADLYATNTNLSRSKLEEHVESPGETATESPFDKYPIVFQSKKKQTIIDGQHRLAALMLLDVTTWPVYLVPK